MLQIPLVLIIAGIFFIVNQVLRWFFIRRTDDKYKMDAQLFEQLCKVKRPPGMTPNDMLHDFYDETERCEREKMKQSEAEGKNLFDEACERLEKMKMKKKNGEEGKGYPPGVRKWLDPMMFEDDLSILEMKMKIQEAKEKEKAQLRKTKKTSK